MLLIRLRSFRLKLHRLYILANMCIEIHTKEINDLMFGNIIFGLVPKDEDLNGMAIVNL